MKRKQYTGGGKNLKWIILLVLVVAVVAITLTRSKEEESIENTSNDYLVKGIDLSHHNPFPNWQKLEEEGVAFVYLKATEGTTHQDRNFLSNYAEGKRTNIKIGAYHFYTFAESGEEQAKYFIAIANSQPGDLIPAIDVEHAPGNPHSHDKQYVAKVIKELKTLENELYNYYGVHPVIYTNNNCYKLYIEGNFADNPLWMVDLEKGPSPKLKNWRIWQFSHKGRVAGLDGNTDLNYYRYTIKEFQELLLP